MQIVAGGAQRRGGKVRVRFADGTDTVVSDVELPQRKSAGDKYVSLIGLGLILGLWMIVGSLRGPGRDDSAPARPAHLTGV